jgi:hypothetical protein
MVQLRFRLNLWIQGILRIFVGVAVALVLRPVGWNLFGTCFGMLLCFLGWSTLLVPQQVSEPKQVSPTQHDFENDTHFVGKNTKATRQQQKRRIGNWPLFSPFGVWNAS